MKNNHGVECVKIVMEDGEEILYNIDCVIPEDIDRRKVVGLEV